MQRLELRTRTELPCEIWLADRQHHATILNVSPGGFFAQTDLAPAVGEPVEVRLGGATRSDRIRVRGTVAHRRPPASYPTSLVHAAQAGFGLCIEEAPESYRRFVDAIAANAAATVDATSVRGFIFEHAVEQVRVLRDQGWVPSAELEFQLDPDDFAYLDAKIAADRWYPVASLDRMLQVVLGSVCRGDSGVFATHAAEVGKEYLASEEFSRFLREAQQRGLAAGTMVALHAEETLLRGFRWRFEGESLADFRMVLSHSDDVQEALRFAIQGALELVFSKIARFPVSVMSIRLDRDAIIYRGERIQIL